MADLSITSNDVIAGADSQQESGTAGQIIGGGRAITKSPTDNKWYLSDSNSASAWLRTVGGIALNSAAANQPIRIHKSGDVTLGTVMTANVPYFLSDTPGGICPIADVGSGEYLVQIGIAKSTSVMAVRILATGVAN